MAGLEEAGNVGSPAQGSPLSDEEVVRRVRGGDTALFEVLMRRYNQRLFRVARAILKDEDEAEDVMQQAYVNAYTHLHQFEERARFGTWLTRIAVHEALARLRRRGRLEEVDAMPEFDKETMELLTSKDPSPEDQARCRELRGILESSFDAIPEIYRSVFLLREVEGLSTMEAAGCLRISEDTVKTRLHRARGLLRQELFERAGLTAAELFPLHLSRCDRVVAAVFAQLSLPPPRSLHCGCPGEFCHVHRPRLAGSPE
jgi:RNA polymerase sigma-70 factor (ECF subfamily)